MIEAAFFFWLLGWIERYLVLLWGAGLITLIGLIWWLVRRRYEGQEMDE